MDKFIGRQLKNLESTAESVLSERERRKPFIRIKPWSILADIVNVEYFPNGVYTEKMICHEGLTLDQTLKLVKKSTFPRGLLILNVQSGYFVSLWKVTSIQTNKKDAFRMSGAKSIQKSRHGLQNG